MAQKEVKEILGAPGRHWVGNGFHVFPVFHDRAFTAALSPWLMFDYAAPKDFKPSYERRGVGQHPHRGFETITIAFQGEVEHGDSVGNRDVIGPGDVQWMTAGRGIIHEEFHSTDFQQTGGTFEMAQLWLNLPKKHKVRSPYVAREWCSERAAQTVGLLGETRSPASSLSRRLTHPAFLPRSSKRSSRWTLPSTRRSWPRTSPWSP